MKERDPYGPQSPESEPFWQFDEVIGEIDIGDEPTTIHLRAHISEEHYHRGTDSEEIVPLAARRGTRVYVMARPYILEPDISFTIALYPTPAPDGAIGEVVSSEQKGVRPREIGQAQAWLYREERTLILWEAYLHDWARTPDPRADTTLKAVWEGFERFLLRHLEGVDRIVSPSWEPIYEDTTAWRQFLESLGYRQVNDRAFEKQL